MRRNFIAGVLLLGLVAACAPDAKDVAPTPTGEPTTTLPGVGPVAPLTGLPQGDEALRNRPLLTVKIDNHPEARPQFGIDRADVIVEEKVEGGVSRFMALFHSEDVDRVGPVRSLRSTDAKWLRPEGGLIAYSGGIDPVKKLLGSNGIKDIGADNHGTKYYKRRSDRPFEHSMYVNTNVLRELTPKDTPGAKALIEYAPPSGHFDGAGIAPVSSITVRMDGGVVATTFDWTWDAAAGVFRRGTDGKPHNIENVGQVGMKNVIVQFTPYQSTPWRDRANTPVDEAVVVGEGEAWFLSDGKLVKGRWSRPNADAITKFTDAAGTEMKFPPGKLWLSLVPPGQFTEVR